VCWRRKRERAVAGGGCMPSPPSLSGRVLRCQLCGGNGLVPVIMARNVWDIAVTLSVKGDLIPCRDGEAVSDELLAK
jgi:hypothetical protein